MKMWLISVIAMLGLASAAEPEADAEQLPRIPATEPEDALDTFELVDGYELQLVAHEPQVVDPIAMAFDEHGSMYVVEMRGYSERRDDALGRIRKLTDTDDDGVYETSTVYADGLRWPTCVTCYKGGIFVGATPDLFYFKDANGDDVADEKRVVFTGFGPPEGEMKVNMQALFNSLKWGPDNRIWGVTAASGGNVTRPDVPEMEPISLRNADFSFDPETMDFRAENGTAQYGMDFDEGGNRYVCSNSNHIIRVMWERGWTTPNPDYSLPNPLVSIANDGKAAPVFRISPDEPWRIMRTRWRVSGAVKGAVEGGGRVSGYFTSATGITIYKGDAMPESRGMAFIGDVGSNLVHRKQIVYQDGLFEPTAERVDEGREIVASRDNWFRPVNFANAPDGSLYIADMYRETIEHPWSIPPGIKKHLDLNSGSDRGRIYRLVRAGWEQPSTKRYRDLDTEKWISRSLPRSGWENETDRRLAYELDLIPLPPFPKTRLQLSLILGMGFDPAESHFFDPWLEENLHDPWMRASIVLATRTKEQAKKLFALTASEPLKIELAIRINDETWVRANTDSPAVLAIYDPPPPPPAPPIVAEKTGEDRQKIVARYLPALKLTGDAARGHEVYRRACITCHATPVGEGFSVGPDLASFANAGGESIIGNLFDPNREIAPQYHAFQFTMKDGTVHIGLIAQETPTEVILKNAGGIETRFLRKDVAGTKALGISLMPEGLEAGLTEQDVADLLQFIARG